MVGFLWEGPPPKKKWAVKTVIFLNEHCVKYLMIVDFLNLYKLQRGY